MTERHWSAIAKTEDAENYIDHLKKETFVNLKRIDGFINAKILTRTNQVGVNFLVITEWENVNAIKQFAGENFEIAVVPDKVKAMMLAYDQTVQHYEVRYKATDS